MNRPAMSELTDLLAILAERTSRELDTLIAADPGQLSQLLAEVPMPAPPPRWQDRVILEHIPSRASVLDLGCGSGDLLLALRQQQISGQGVELSHEAVQQCVERGVPVIQANLDLGLDSFPSNSIDVVVCEQTLQTLSRPAAVLGEMLRVGRRAIASFPNFGHWRVRLDLALRGRMPTSPGLPYQWYDTPNIHLFTIADFTDWVRQHGCQVAAAWVLVDGAVRPIQDGDNLRAEEALFVVEPGHGTTP